MKQIEDLNNAIIELILKKYKLTDFHKIHHFKHTNINADKIKLNLTHEIKNIDDIINTYVNKNKYLCYYFHLHLN